MLCALATPRRLQVAPSLASLVTSVIESCRARHQAIAWRPLQTLKARVLRFPSYQCPGTLGAVPPLFAMSDKSTTMKRLDLMPGDRSTDSNW